MSKLGATLLIAIGALAMVIGAPGVYLAVYAYTDLGALGSGSFLLTVGGIAIAATIGIVAAYNADPSRSRFPSWALSLVILAGSVLAVGYDTVNRMQFERERTEALKTQAALRQDNATLQAENARIKETANKTYAAALALNRSSSRMLTAVEHETASTGRIEEQIQGLVLQAGSLQSTANAALLRLQRLPTPSPRPHL